MVLLLGSVLNTTATGVRLRQLPMNPSRVLEALWAQQKSWDNGNGVDPNCATIASQR
jgi:hypothetical protein